MYDVSLPANAEIYVNEFKNLIEFEALNPEKIVQLWEPDFVMKDFITGLKNNIID